ncbi:MerR family transcriptional regulator [Plantactinospora siamensis]|uniref:MerR family transcriptional regulator n=1 Tax=Plantactinospora siamensis TaxID=555372 RepID=A0ABV6P1Z6_9ACTN
MDEPLLSIGQLARRTGLTVRAIRFWSDAGLVPPTGRSAAGYRRYDAAAVARLDLVRTLRDLGLDLGTIRRLLDRQATVGDVVHAQIAALDTQIRTLRLRRAILRSVAGRAEHPEGLRLMNELARMSAEERQRMIDEFVDRAFAGIDPAAPGAGLAGAMRQLDLPDDPAPDQVAAWLELAELVSDRDFADRVRAMVLAGSAQPADGDRAMNTWQVVTDEGHRPDLVLAEAGPAAAAGVDPGSPPAAAVLHRIIDPALPAADRARLADRVAVFTDRRVERYWQLMGLLNGRPTFPPASPAFEWFAAALRAHPPVPAG